MMGYAPLGGVLIGIGSCALADFLGFHHVSMVGAAALMSGCVLVVVGVAEALLRKSA